MRRQERVYDAFVFYIQHRTGGVGQYTVITDEGCGLVQNGQLCLRQLGQLLGRQCPFARRCAPPRAAPGTGGVSQHQVKRAVFFQVIRRQDGNARSRPSCSVRKVTHAPGVGVVGEDFDTARGGHGQRLAATPGTIVQNPHARTKVQCSNDSLARRILQLDKAVAIALGLRNLPGTIDNFKRRLASRVRRSGNPFPR